MVHEITTSLKSDQAMRFSISNLNVSRGGSVSEVDDIEREPIAGRQTADLARHDALQQKTLHTTTHHQDRWTATYTTITHSIPSLINILDFGTPFNISKSSPTAVSQSTTVVCVGGIWRMFRGTNVQQDCSTSFPIWW